MSGPGPASPIPSAQLDDLRSKLVVMLEESLPGRLHSLYLFGSYVDGSAVPSSDLDLFVVLRGELLEGEAEASRVREIAFHLSRRFAVHVDVLPFGENQLLRNGHWRLEANSRLLLGEDLRPQLPPETLDRYLRRYSHAPYAYMSQVLRGQDRLIAPVDCPDPAGEFFGYDQQVRPPAPDAGESLKAFVATVCWIATLLSGMQGGLMVRSRHESVGAYREAVGDEWTDFVSDVYRLGKLEWHYCVPNDPADRSRLRDLCRQMLPFENHYLDAYRRFLLCQLRFAEPAARLEAARRLREWVVYRDAEVRRAVEDALAGDHAEVRECAARTLQVIETVGLGRPR